MTDDRIRLQKYLSQCAVASRRKSEELILAGKVKVNGKVAGLGDKVSPRKDEVTVSGKKIVMNRKHYYIMLHKPRGFVTTMEDELGRKCVAQLVKDVGARVYPVGRLDRDSEGLLIMTNDGEFANHMTHPSKHIPKTYRVTVRPDVTDEMLVKFMDGMEIDGRMTAPAEAHIIEKQENRVVLEIVLYEGRNRQIRKMCEAMGLEVARLKRVSVGSIKLGMLPQGKWRELSEDEVHKLMVSSGMKVNKF
ncbi:MAG: rRNA pseudouridine synthase [Clostridia bacterium]|nr:rRNA pseudouridine synthase [Clostridia bacterium]